VSEPFLSGRVGHVGPRRAVALRALDRLLDSALRLRGVPRALDRLAAAVPRRRVLALCVYRPGGELAGPAVAALRRTRHELTLALGATAEADPALAADTVATGLAGGKFENLSSILRVSGLDPGDADWTVVLDDDVVLPPRFLDRLVGLCERYGLTLAQPAQTLASHAAWEVTRRRPLSIARETAFVEIGPVTALRGDAARELTPFPDLRYGWGLDLHWAALARERGWRLGVLDALPVRHERAGVASAYRHEQAVAEARRFLDGRPYLHRDQAARTLAVHRRLP
jgi:hypothetical protein